MTTLMQAHRQWATRPDDERFCSLIELRDFTTNAKNNSTAKVLDSRAIAAEPVDGDVHGLQLVGVGDSPVTPTNWAFGQLAQRAGAPAGYLRELPSPIAADCINYGLRFARQGEELGVLAYRNGGPAELRAVTGPNYGRVWNADMVSALVERFGDGINGDFRVPGEFGKAITVTKKNTTLYASDRDMFVFLADEVHRVEIKNRRDGQPGTLARGFFVWNSETGNRSYGLGTFLFDYACSNRMIWGAEGFTEIRGVHSSGAPRRWLSEVMPAISSYANSSAAPIERQLAIAQEKKIGDAEDIQKFLRSRFTVNQAAAITAIHQNEEQRPIETLWDAATGVTAYARALPHVDARVELEREAGKILSLAA